MVQEDNITSIEDVSQVSGYIMMCLSLPFPLMFQPAYFVCRQDILGRPKKGAIIYEVISTKEIVIVLFACVIACFKDMLSLLW